MFLGARALRTRSGAARCRLRGPLARDSGPSRARQGPRGLRDLRAWGDTARQELERRHGAFDLRPSERVPQADPVRDPPRRRAGAELQSLLVAERPPDRLRGVQGGGPQYAVRWRHLDHPGRRDPPDGLIDNPLFEYRPEWGAGTRGLTRRRLEAAGLRESSFPGDGPDRAQLTPERPSDPDHAALSRRGRTDRNPPSSWRCGASGIG